MHIKEIVYIVQTPFSKRDKERFGIDVFLNHDIKATILDITYYLDKNIAEKYYNTDTEKYDYVMQLKTYNDIKHTILNSPNNTIFIAFIGESTIKALRILNILQKYKKEFGVIYSGSLPSPKKRKGLASKLKIFDFKNFPRLLYKISKRLDYPFVIGSGSESYRIIDTRHTRSNILSGHAFDYDLYLENKKNIAVISQDYIVFLDEFLPFHPDYIRLGIDITHIAKTYYMKLSALFDKMEKYYNIPVVICAHPRSYYDELPNYWGNRKCIRGETISLVKNAKICLLHASTSINFAVLYEKPLLFITMNEVKNLNIQEYMDAMVYELEATVIDLDTLDDNKYQNISFSKTAYKSYKMKYIKRDETNDINNWELLYDFYTNKLEV